MSEAMKITSADAGCWLDGHMGWHNSYRVIERAEEYGFTVTDDERAIIGAYSESADSVTLANGETLDADSIADAIIGQGELSDRATDYLELLTPEGYTFEWDMGELCLIHSPECVSCDHDCPWRSRKGRLIPLGGPHCSVCWDHQENADAMSEEN